ncbi:TonB-dependent receptor [Chitinophaga lutea]|uniref:TonB-dependent receptor n=1 Tax=Chitinophaga lutea TaxID=2488634 RepID=A0A3N4PQJ1_9BACT|nr:TonB-dependent receptor [Chitinophaga lutea]RPE08999.1 TonB-dependent receptor [Chitinophaga lutea]
MKNIILIFTWVFSLLFFEHAMSQTIAVKGRVTDGNQPLPGVSVKIKNTSTGTVTNANGEFSLNAAGTDILIFTFVGYRVREVPVGGRAVINETLSATDSQLGEVVVVGYGVQKKVTTTGAIASVTGKDLVKAPVAGISNALVGLASGITAVQNSGEFGSDKATILIRGMATLNASGRGPLIMIDGVERETYNNLDPNEIETINILKDASATAVFGVRGANGVILITTRQGKVGKPQINVTSNLAAIQPTVLPELLTSYDYALLRNEAQRNMGLAPSFTDEDIRLYRTGEDPVFHPSKNWIRELVKPFSFQQSYNANISGGTEKLRYFTSLGYFNQSGGYHQPEQDFGFPYKHTYDKYNIRMNFDFNPVKELNIAVKLGNQITNNTIPNGGAWGAFDKAATQPPMTSPGFVDGKYIEKINGLPAGVPNFNPWGQAGPTSTGGAFITEDYSSTLNTNLAISYDLHRITPGLSVRAMGSYDSYYLKNAVRRKYFPAYTITRDPVDPAKYTMYRSTDGGPYYNLSEGVAESNKWRKLYTEAAIDYKRTFGRHTVTGLVLGNFQRGHYPSMQFGLPTTYLGLVSRVTYDYKNRYLAEFNMGYNGSENFPENSRFGFFPAVSLGWVVTEEAFLPKNDVLTFLKIRGSYGEVGNDKIGGDRYLYLNGPYALNNGGYQAVVFGEAGTNMSRFNMYREGKLGNPDVTWERARKMNIGAEIKLLRDRLSFTGDYFQEKRDNILWVLSTVPELVAVPLPPANIGKVENRGYEVELGWNDRAGALTYWAKGSYSFARNKIIFQDEPTKAHEWMQRTGRRMGQYFGLTFEGFYNTQAEIDDPKRPKSEWEGTGLKPGDMKYKDLNGDGRINSNDMGPVGFSDWPEIAYSISAGASCKGFDFSVLFQGTENVSVSFSSSAAYPFTASWGSAQQWHLERWTPERYAAGEKITFPRVELSPDRQHNYQPSSFWVQDASYIRLKNAEIGYRFSSGALRRIGLQSMRVYLSGNNLITWTSMKYAKDPDARELWGRVYPSMRVYNGGVNFQF